MRFDQAKFLQIARERGLGNAEPLRGQAAAQLFLIADVLIGDQAEDLTVAVCFTRAHPG